MIINLVNVLELLWLGVVVAQILYMFEDIYALITQYQLILKVINVDISILIIWVCGLLTSLILLILFNVGRNG